MSTENWGVQETAPGCCKVLVKYRELSATPGVSVFEWLDTAIETSTTTDWIDQVFSDTGVDWLPAHPNAPDVIRVNPNFDINTTQVWSSHQSIYEAWVYFPKAWFIRDNDTTAEKGRVYLGGCCGQIKQAGDDWTEAVPRKWLDWQPYAVWPGLHKIRVYLHDRSGTNSGFDLEYSEDGNTWVNNPYQYTGKPIRECKYGTYSECDGMLNDSGNPLVQTDTVKFCKPTCDECLKGLDGIDGRDGTDGIDWQDWQDWQDGQDGQDGQDWQDWQDGSIDDLTIERIQWPFLDTSNRDARWDWWTPVYTANSGTITKPRDTNNFTAETSPPILTDILVNIDFGHLYYLLRRMRMYYWVDVRLLINNVVVQTWTYDVYLYDDDRQDTNPDVIDPLHYDIKPLGSSFIQRNNVAPSSTVSIEVRERYNFNGAQTSAYGRLIAWLRSHFTVTYIPRFLVTNVT